MLIHTGKIELEITYFYEIFEFFRANFYDLCMPCQFNYDYIGHLSNNQIETKFITDIILKQSEKTSFDLSFDGMPVSNPSKPFGSVDIELENVPRELIERVKRNYKIDYEMFNFQQQ